jgi:UDP-3-O-[3-hydroxymyristoyl] glucosamine N-acyltransferase
MEFSALQIAQLLNGRVEGDETCKVSALSKIEEGEKGSITFLANPKYTPFIYTTKASVVVVKNEFVPEQEISATLIRVEDAYSSFAKLLDVYTKSDNVLKGVSRKARIHKKCKIGKNVYIGDFVTVGEFSSIGDNTVIHGNVTIYPKVKIGNNCLIHGGAIILDACEIGNNCIIQPGAIIGSDGFGFAPIKDGKYLKIPQTGNVILEDDVEIGANSTIDRATMGSTIIRKGAKIDNLIQIGHNCDIGPNTVMAGQSGVSGSTKLGANCMVGGQTGIAGHLKIGSNVKIAAKSGVINNIEDGEFQMGAPSFNAREYKKSYIHFSSFDKFAKRITDLEHQLKMLKQDIE